MQEGGLGAESKKGIFNYNPSEQRDRYGKWVRIEKPMAWGIKNYKGWWNGLSVSEKSTLGEYTAEGYLTINKGLREKSNLDRGTIADIQAITKILQVSTVPHNVYMYRGAEKKFYDSRIVGEVFRDEGFISTSLVRNRVKTIALEAHPGKVNKTTQIVVMRILVPKGTHGAYIPDNPDAGTAEHELLLQRGTRFKVLNKDDKCLTLMVLPQNEPPSSIEKISLLGRLLKRVFNAAYTQDRFTWVHGDVVTERKDS